MRLQKNIVLLLVSPPPGATGGDKDVDYRRHRVRGSASARLLHGMWAMLSLVMVLGVCGNPESLHGRCGVRQEIVPPWIFNVSLFPSPASKQATTNLPPKIESRWRPVVPGNVRLELSLFPRNVGAVPREAEEFIGSAS